ncbi:Gfo/Idh/MocA family protein [Paludisphaera rhizosphaerae]|uniref:Gfo/Idh/MocA family protein n=1 Tax=Paludisphaera rhizosphaerae TaxID=2711216 RepID=UPI0013EDE8A9|nr:Gfo/Idh/MocA family oxidoreductase [Paludisphaera rhizosphaerae]
MDGRRVLIIGAGSIGERHLRCFLATGRCRAAFVETNPRRRAEVADRYPQAVAHETLEHALEQRPGAAVIATPAPSHIPLATRLVELGIPVLVEKPLSVSLDGVEALAVLTAEQRASVAVAYVMRARPPLAEMRRALASGRFGRPLQLVATAGQDFAHYRPAYRETYYADRSSGGGAVQDALTHLINAGEWLVGGVDRVVADAARLRIEGVDVEDTVHVLARQGDVMADYALNQHQAPNETTITVACERGTVRFELHAGRWLSCERAGAAWLDHGPGGPLDPDAPFMRQAEAFLDACEGTAPPLCTLEEGTRTLRANLAILESVETGRWVETASVGARS